jgi:dimethylargininase
MADRPQFRGYEIIRVPPEETYAANCIEVNGQVLIATGFPKLAAALANQGFQYLPLEVSEFQKMDGGLSCLSLRF